jgi:hypothetical protein
MENLKEPPDHHMQTFHPLNLKYFVLHFGEGLLPQASLNLGLHPWVTTLQATTFKLGETLGNMGTGLPLDIYYIVIPTFPSIHMEES